MVGCTPLPIAFSKATLHKTRGWGSEGMMRTPSLTMKHSQTPYQSAGPLFVTGGWWKLEGSPLVKRT